MRSTQAVVKLRLLSRFQFVADHRGAYGVKRLCEVLDVNRSSYYKWLSGRKAWAARQREDRLLAERIRGVHGESGGAYGSPRVTAELRAQGLRVNEKRVARVMRTFSITGVRLRRRVRTTVPDPAASPVPDLFQRDFTAAEPGRKYMGDITYLPLTGGKSAPRQRRRVRLPRRRTLEARAWPDRATKDGAVVRGLGGWYHLVAGGEVSSSESSIMLVWWGTRLVQRSPATGGSWVCRST
ncbi:IS3 family transposase [Streptomyces sp. NPDC058442]|uniref:IS3 family transposase n=1 Tax=Streptomyces sp. NPDC058442 TaxID=3346503 RepID=UPI0036566D88